MDKYIKKIIPMFFFLHILKCIRHNHLKSIIYHDWTVSLSRQIIEDVTLQLLYQMQN